MLCYTCGGSGTLITRFFGVMEWIKCHTCGGHGGARTFGPSRIHVHDLRKKKKK